MRVPDLTVHTQFVQPTSTQAARVCVRWVCVHQKFGSFGCSQNKRAVNTSAKHEPKLRGAHDHNTDHNEACQVQLQTQLVESELSLQELQEQFNFSP